MLLFLLSFVVGTVAFASVQSAWGACNMFSKASVCLCDPNNFASRLPFALLADAGMLQTYTGRSECAFNMSWFHGSPDQFFLEFVSWLFLWGEKTNRTDIMEGALWMSVDPVLDGITLYAELQGAVVFLCLFCLFSVALTRQARWY
jgi:hypothetical protein